MVSSLVSFLALFTPGTFSDWVHVGAVRAAGFEKSDNSHPQPFTVIRSDSSFVYTFRRNADGYLSGLLRTELGTPKGIFTWISGNPRFILELPAPSAPQFIQSLLPARFRRNEVLSDPREIERATGKKVSSEGEQNIAARNCLILSFADKEPLVQTLWIDEQTGLTLRQRDKLSNELVYERRLSSIETLDQVSPISFSLPSGAVVIQGLVSPDILALAEEAPRAPLQLSSDVTLLRSTSSIGSGSWILQPTLPLNFEYVGSKHAEDPHPGEADMGAPAKSVDSGFYSYFGGPPAGWLVSSAEVKETVSRKGDVVELPTYLGLDPLLSGSHGSLPSINQAASPSAEAIVRSEFLDPKTGDTVTVLQFRNLSLIDALNGFRPEDLHAFGNPRHPGLNAFEMRKPAFMSGVEWRNGETHYAIVSTSLDAGQLQQIADAMGG